MNSSFFYIAKVTDNKDKENLNREIVKCCG